MAPKPRPNVDTIEVEAKKRKKCKPDEIPILAEMEGGDVTESATPSITTATVATATVATATVATSTTATNCRKAVTSGNAAFAPTLSPVTESPEVSSSSPEEEEV